MYNLRPRPTGNDLFHISSTQAVRAIKRAKINYKQLHGHLKGFRGDTQHQPSHAYPARKSIVGKARRWMLDSGASIHILCTDDLTEEEKRALVIFRRAFKERSLEKEKERLRSAKALDRLFYE